MRERMNFRCSSCGEYVSESGSGDSFLDCCGRSRVKLSGQAGEAFLSQHLPVAEIKDGRLLLHIGRRAHPMEETHHIDWVAVELDGQLRSVSRAPGEPADAAFDIRLFLPREAEAPAEPAAFFRGKKMMVYVHCSLHGLWRVETAL